MILLQFGESGGWIIITEDSFPDPVRFGFGDSRWHSGRGPRDGDS